MNDTPPPPRIRPGLWLALVRYLGLAALAAAAVLAWALIELDSRDRDRVRLQERLAAEVSTRRQLQADHERLLEESDALRAGPEQRYQLGVHAERDARYREAELAFEEMAAMYPTHELAPRAREEAARMRELQMERNLSVLHVTLSDVETGWVAAPGPDGRRYHAEIGFRLRNVGIETLSDGYVRVEFQGVGEAFEPLAPLQPDEARAVIVRSLSALESAAEPDQVPDELPDVVAYVWIRVADHGFLRVGAWPVGKEVDGLP